MPRTSERRKIIQQLEAYIVWQDFFEDWDDIETNEKDDDDNFGFIDQETPEELLQFVYAHRYLEPRNRIPKSRDWVENVLPNYDPVRFRQTLRVSSEGFQEIFENITSYSVFDLVFSLLLLESPILQGEFQFIAVIECFSKPRFFFLLTDLISNLKGSSPAPSGFFELSRF